MTARRAGIVCTVLLGLMPAGSLERVSAQENRLNLDYRHIIVSTAARVFRVLEISSVADPTPAGDRIGFVATLPPGFDSLELQDAEDVRKSPTGFFASFPAPADGGGRIVYSYTVKRAPTFTLDVRLDYDTEAIEILYPPEITVTETAGLLRPTQSVVYGDRRFARLSGSRLKQGQVVKLTFEAPESAGALPQPSVSRKPPQFHSAGHIRIWYQSPLRKFDPHVSLLVGLVIIVAAVGIPVVGSVKKRRLLDKADDGATEEDDFLALVHEKEALLSDIVEMEMASNSGKIDSKEAREKIAALRGRLVDVQIQLDLLSKSETE